MPRTITINNDKDFAWLKDYIDRWQIRCNGSPGQYTEHIEMFDRLHEDFATSRKTTDASLPDTLSDVRPEALPEKKTRKKRTQPSESKHEYNYCSTHTTYGAMRSPRTDCAECWLNYERLNPNRAHVAKAKFERKRA